MKRYSSGFTLLEMLVTMAVIIATISIVLINYTSFTGRSGLRVRVAEIAEFVRFAQERSASTEPLTASAVTEGFQVVRVRVRDGALHDVRQEKVVGSFSRFAATVPAGTADFHTAAARTVTGSQVITLQPQEEYLVDVCFIDINTPATPYYRRALKVGGVRCTATTGTVTDMLCSEPDPAVLTSGGASAVRRNNFDVVFSVEQPTREVYAKVISRGGGAYQYGAGAIQPGGANERISGTYEGVRLALISDGGLKRSVDVYRTGLVSTGGDDTAGGCEAASSLDHSGVPIPAPSCAASTVDNCVLSTAVHGGTGGTCAAGTTGSCRYGCARGVWNRAINTCR